MQLDDDKLDNDNNEFSLDDDSDAISWQDLLGDDDTSDLSEAINNPETVNGNNSEFKEFDLDALANNISTDDNEADILQEDNQIQENAVSEEALPSLESDFETEQAGAEDFLSAIDSDIEIEPENTQTQSEIQQTQPSNNETYVSDDEILLSDNNNNINVENSDLSGIVDDELLSILDESDDLNLPLDTTDSEENIQPAAISTFGSDGSITSNEDIDDLLSDSDNAAINLPENEHSDDLLQNDNSVSNQENQEVYDETSGVEAEDKKPKAPSKVPMLLGILALAIVLVGSFYLWKGYSDQQFKNQYATSPDGVVEEAPDDFLDDEDTGMKAEAPKARSEEKPMEKASVDKKQKDELLDKVGANKKQTEDARTDKKVVVNVVTGGRSNPFVPSSSFNDKGFASIGASIPMPPDGVIDTPEAAEARKLLSISVSGIMFDPSKPSAILRFDGKDYFVQKGDRIDTYTVNQITKEYVAIRNAANIYKAYVGESFQLEGAQIPPSQQMKYKGNVRQYISADDIQISKK